MDNKPRTVTTRSAEELAISMPLPQPSETAAQPPSWFRTCSSILRNVHVGTLLAAYASLIGLLQLKYQSKQESAFETHSFFMTMSVVAIIMFALSYWILDYKSKNSNMNQLPSSVHHMILVTVALFSAILAPLSLVLVLLVPPKLMWIGHGLLFLVVIVTTVYSSIDNVTSLGKKMHTAILELINYIIDKFRQYL